MLAAEISLGELAALGGVVIVALGLAVEAIRRALGKLEVKIDHVEDRIDSHMTQEEKERAELQKELNGVSRALVWIAAKANVDLPRPD